MNIYVYRYLIKSAFSEKTLVAVHALTEDGHKKYIEQLKNDEDIVMFSREYLHEYDADKMYQVETFKKEQGENEEI